MSGDATERSIRSTGLEELGRDRAVDAAERVGEGQRPRGTDEHVAEVGGHDVVVGFPRHVVVEAGGERVPHASGQEAPDAGDDPDGDARVAGDSGRRS